MVVRMLNTGCGWRCWSPTSAPSRFTSIIRSFALVSLETPAGGAVWPGRPQRTNRLGRDFVDVPGWWPGARSAVGGGEGGPALVNRGRPAVGPERLGDARDLGRVGHFDGGALHDEVEVVRGDREDAVW